MYGLCLEYEDLNNHDDLRRDAAIQTAVETDRNPVSSPTLCRFESRADRQSAFRFNAGYCFLPLYVFSGHHLICAMLRKSRIDPAKHSSEVLKLLVT